MPASTMQLNLRQSGDLLAFGQGLGSAGRKQVGRISMPSNGGLRGFLVLKK